MTEQTGSEDNSSENKASPGSIDFTPTDSEPIFVTPAAVEAVKNAIKQEGEESDGIRISVVGGGCSGYQYGP